MRFLSKFFRASSFPICTALCNQPKNEVNHCFFVLQASPAPRIKNYLKDSRSESYVVATAFKLEEPEAENR